MDPAKLKVVELRAELAKRGLDQKGVKAVLVARLQEALEAEDKGETEEDEEEEQQQEEAEEEEATVQSEFPAPKSDPGGQDETSAQSVQSSEPEAHPEEDSNQYASYAEESESKLGYEDQSSDTWNQQSTTQQGEEESERSFEIQQSSFHLDDSNAQDALDTRPKPEEEFKSEAKEITDQTTENEELKMETVEIKQETEEENIPAPPAPEIKQEAEAPVEEEEKKPEVDKANENKTERKNRWDNARPTEAKKRQRSPSEPRQMSPVSKKPDDEPDFDEKAVLLSWYDSDLHMLINKENFSSATLITHSGFGYVWAGARATYGFEKGKVYYEVRVTENIKVPYLEDEPHPNILRVGWSVQSTSLQLGEEPLSYGFGGTGKISTKCQFTNYGKPFVINDVVGCYLDMDSNQIEISYTINGEYQGVAYNINHEELKGQPLFPHILSKNCSFEVNFGNRGAWAHIMSGYTNVGEVPLENRIPGPKRPEKREDCEVIMMIGLPACGKTTWAMKYAEEHKDKMYNVLGTNALIEKMKVMGMPRRRNYSGRWDVLIAKCTKCLNTLLEIAAYRRRNYIIDQTNVYPSAQRRKMRGFEGFVRRAVVMVPTDEELKARTAKREAEEGKDVPDSAILEMKANFGLPEKGDVFHEVIFTDLQEEEAKKLILQYNKEGNDHGYFSHSQQQKRLRLDDGRNDRRDSFRNQEGDQRRMDHRGPRQEGRGGPDGWRDRGFNNRRRGDFRGGRGPPRPMGGWRGNRGGGGWRGGPPNRFNDRGGHSGPRDMRDRGRDFRDRRDGPPNKMPDRPGRPGDRDDKRVPKPPMAQPPQQNWGAQAQGYNQNWNQVYGNQNWGNWNQGYNQQQWKNYQQLQQQQQQTLGQGWSNAGNLGYQQYYNQYQQSWAQPQGMTGSTNASSTGTDSTTMAATYASYGQAGAWPGYATAGYAAAGSAGASGTSGTGTASTAGSSTTSYQPMQKQYRPDPRKPS